MYQESTNTTKQNTGPDGKVQGASFGQHYPSLGLKDQTIQMQPLEEEEEEIQMKPASESMSPDNFEAQSQISKELGKQRNKGQALPSKINSEMSESFGRDFSNVHVHTGSKAIQMNRQLGAKAFTHQNNIFFNAGMFKPGTSQGKHLLAHELTHVVQQGYGGAPHIQRAIGDGHDLSSPRFATDTTLQDIYDSTTQTLKNGDENESVRKVQHAIHDAGFLFLGHGVDGKFGNLTERYVRRFQRRNRITTDPQGEVGDSTIEKLDQLYPALSISAAASDPFSFPVMLQILCGWNSAMIRDLKKLGVILVADLEWADEEFDGSGWVPAPMDGAGETDGHTIYLATDDSNEKVAQTLYHEYQHARAPYVFRHRTWEEEEEYTYRVETDWAISRGLTPDPDHVTTDPVTGETVADEAAISGTVETYPGLDTANPGEVIGKVGSNRVRVEMPDGSTIVRNAVAGDTVSGRRVLSSPRRRVRDREWRC